VTELGFEEWGEGPPILLLHAFPLDSRMWLGQRSALATVGRALAVDFPGFGQSPPPAEEVSFERLAGAILAELRRRRVTSISAIGFSMGGYLLFELLRQNPELFDRIVLADTRAEPDTAESQKQREITAERTERTGVGHLVDAIPRLLSARPPYEVTRFVEDLALSATPRGVAAASRAMAKRRDQRDLLSAIASPTLVMVGAEDGVTTVAQSRRMADAIPGAELRVLPGAGHLSNLEAEDGFNRALVSFLSQ
jgi:pimeloyl-ACP methyl ester carboxylesterase